MGGRKANDLLHHDKLMKWEDQAIPMYMRMRTRFLEGKLELEPNVNYVKMYIFGTFHSYIKWTGGMRI